MHAHVHETCHSTVDLKLGKKKLTQKKKKLLKNPIQRNDNGRTGEKRSSLPARQFSSFSHTRQNSTFSAHHLYNHKTTLVHVSILPFSHHDFFLLLFFYTHASFSCSCRPSFLFLFLYRLLGCWVSHRGLAKKVYMVPTTNRVLWGLLTRPLGQSSQ